MKIRKFNKPVSKTVQDKAVKSRFSEKDFVNLMSDANKYPLAMRIAAELFRGGVTGRRFLDAFHIEGNSFSMQVLDHMSNFDLKKSFDPKGIPPVVPQFLRYVPPAKVEEIKFRAKKGRPTSEEAHAFLRKMLNDRLASGWDEVDFINTLREMVDSSSGPAKKVSIDTDLDDEDEKPSKKVSKAYFVRIGKQWERFTTLGESTKAMEADTDKVMGPVDVPESGIHCDFCKFRLNGVVVIVRKPAANGLPATTEHMHMGCYWMEVAHPSQIPIGMEVLSAPEGISYKYHGADKGGWKRKETVTDETPVTGGNSSEGVPLPQGTQDKQTTTLPPKKKAG